VNAAEFLDDLERRAKEATGPFVFIARDEASRFLTLSGEGEAQHMKVLHGFSREWLLARIVFCREYVVFRVTSKLEST
jgi:hypothetical protein